MDYIKRILYINILFDNQLDILNTNELLETKTKQGKHLYISHTNIIQGALYVGKIFIIRDVSSRKIAEESYKNLIKTSGDINSLIPNWIIKEMINFFKSNRIKYSNKSILIFDEMITGLRTLKGSVQNYYNLKPDISLFGKSFGGGLPIGIIGLNKKIEAKIKKKN